MSRRLSITLGQYSDKGRKAVNQDFHGACIPDAPLLDTKGIVVALADGISSSPVSHIASESAVKSFLDDYFCTSEAWTVKKSAQCVLFATNSWLYAQTRQSQYRYEKDRGYVCTFSALILKSNTAHVFHVGDGRVYRVHDNALEQLTNDHRLWLSQEEHYLTRALGMNDHLELDYVTQGLVEGALFLLTTDGVHEFVTPQFIAATLREHADDLDLAAQLIASQAMQAGSPDNMTLQMVRVETLPEQGAAEVHQQLAQLPLPPLPEPRALLDGFRIIRLLHASSRSHVYLARDEATGRQAAIKFPSVDLRDNQAYLERFLLEDWIARRLNSPHVLKAVDAPQRRSCLYLAMEYIEGQTLRQWMLDNPGPAVETVRTMVEQIARGLQAFHRMEMLHQDLRPENVMIDAGGLLRIIDFGAVRVAGLEEGMQYGNASAIHGTAQYTAPEYFLGEHGSSQSDIFSLGVIAYEMLSGRLPFGAEVAKTRTRAQQNRLQYQSVLDAKRAIPAWLDSALQKAVQPDPAKRYTELSEFIYDLRHPNEAFLRQTRRPLLERDPVAFWRGLSALLALLILALLLWK